MKERSEGRLWGFDDAERGVLVAATAPLPDLGEVVARAERHKEIAGLWIVWATGDELDELYSLVEALKSSTRARKERELYQGMLATLCQSIDGFWSAGGAEVGGASAGESSDSGSPTKSSGCAARWTSA